MKSNKILFCLSTLFLVGCNGGNTKVDELTKFKNASDAAIEKVDVLNVTLGKVFKQDKISSKNSSKNSQVMYFNCNDYNYCEEQMFGLYIFNNIYYCLHNFYDNTNVKIGEVIGGETKNLPDWQLEELYKQHSELPTPTLVTKSSLAGDENNYIVNFEADWDFRNDKFKSMPGCEYLNSVISTTGKINYSREKGIQNINLNYYWTGIDRDFASFNLDYVNNKFYCICLSSDKANLSFDKQKDKDATIYKLWNKGDLTSDKVRDLNYHYMYAYEGDITTDITKLNLKSKERFVEDFSSEIVETQEGKKDFDDLFNDVYTKNKDVIIRGDDNLIDKTNLKNVNIDNCVLYGEAKTKLFWIYSDEKNDSRKFTKAVTPYQNKDNLIKHFNTLKTKEINDNQKALLDKSITYLNELSDAQYFGEFNVNNNFKYEYQFTGDRSYRNNVFEVSKLQYVLTDLTKSDVTVKFIIDNNEVKINEFF